MKHFSFCFLLMAGLVILSLPAFAQSNANQSDPDEPVVIRTEVDNMGYWMKLANMGLVPYNQPVPVPPAEFKGSSVESTDFTSDSPDVQITGTNTTQSENSVFVDPEDATHVLNSNNSGDWSGSTVNNFYGSDYWNTYNSGLNWSGSTAGAGGDNSGDPTTAISRAGRQYVGYIADDNGQGVAYSDNGTTWTHVQVGTSPGSWDLLDKNHLWIDNSPASAYQGNLYDAWTRFDSGHSNDNEIEISRSTNNGVSWSTPVNISSGVSAGSHNQGVNIQTGPLGQVYVCWSIYDSWPSDETAIGFCRSTNGGSSYTTASRIITNIRGIRDSETSKNQRVNSFPSMTVDLSGGTYNGHIYIVWTNIGTPGVNTGTNRSIYMSKSTNGGTSWSTPVRVNQGPTGNGYEAYFPWITCDPTTGNLYCIFYDDRNTTSTSCEVFVAMSTNGGSSWTDMRVSDVSFTPSPIPGMASGYMGDYLGIAALDNIIYPTWTDNRSGHALSYCSPLNLGGYCSASGGCDEYIAIVQIGSINNSSACDGYHDYTALSASVPINGQELLTVTNGVTTWPSDQCGVWIDWNDDGDFYDSGEAPTVSGTPGVGPYTAMVDPPTGLSVGDSRTMRIRITYSGTVDPCGATTYGEVEDYTITIGPASPNYWTGAVSNDWSVGGNWSLGHEPTVDENVFIPGGTPNDPFILSGQYAYSRNLTVQSGATLTQEGTSYFYVYGIFNTDAGTFIQTGTAYLYFDGPDNTSWDDDNEDDVYRYVRVNKDDPAAQVNMWQNMTVTGNFEIREGRLVYDPTANWTLTVTGTGSNAFEVESGGTFVLINNQALEVAGGIEFEDGSKEEITGGTIRCGGNFRVMANASNNITLTGGTLVMDGGSTQYINDEDGGTLDINNLTIDKTGGACYIQNANLDVNNDLIISGGALSCDNGPSPTATYNIYIAGNWTNSVGPAGFVESTGRVIFNGTGHQYVNSSETFNILEANMGAALRVNNIGHTVTCNSYDWTSGGIDILAGTFTANDLTDSGLFGGYWVNPDGTINLYQDGGQYVDLNGSIWMGGGNMNVYGGNGASWWSYAGDASVTMSGGTLDFKDVGIYVYNSGTYTFTENITAGIIRTSASFNAARSEFTPSGGVVELYGPSDAPVTQSNGATFYNFLVNKGTKEGNPGSSSPVTENRNGEILFAGGGGKANTVTPTSDITITNNLNVVEGILSLATYIFDVAKDANFEADLVMTSGAFNVGTASFDNLSFLAGSAGSVTGGAINLASWFYAASGSAFIASPANTMYFAGSNVTGIDIEETGIVLGNVDINKTSTNHLIYTTGQLVELDGNLTLHGSSVLDMQANNSMRVHGVVTDASGTTIYVYNGPGEGGTYSAKGETGGGSGAKGCMLEIDTDFTMNGFMDLNGDGNVLVHGNFGMEPSAELTIAGAGASFIVDKAYNDSEAWQYLYGTINLSDGLFEISHNSIRFSSTSVNNVSGGTIRCGFTFFASASNVFQPSGGVVEMIGSDLDPYLQCDNGNYFYNLTIDRANELALFSDIQVNNDMLIEAGPLNTNYTSQYNISVGRNWTNNGGDPAFLEGAGTVTFFGPNAGDILTPETFYNMTVNKTYTGFDGLEVMSVPVVVSNNLNIPDGTLELNSNTVFTTGGNVNISSGAGLNAGGSDSNIELYIGGNWTNNNTSYNTIAGYTPGGEIITFNGSLDQVITTAAPQEDFNDFVVNKPGGAVKPADNIQILGTFDIFSGNFYYQVTGLTHYLHGNMTMHGPGGFAPSPSSTTIFKGTADQTFERLGGTAMFGNIVVDKSADESAGYKEVSGGEPVSIPLNAEGEEAKAMTLTLLSNMVAFNGGATTIEEGALDLNGNDFKSSGAININDNGVLYVPAGSNLSVVTSIDVNNGGLLKTEGVAGNNALVYKDVAGLYVFEVNSGGTISAVYTTFRDMSANGIYLKSGALVDGSASFHNCTFRDAASSPSALLTIHNNQVFDVNNAIFPTNTWGGQYNVWKNVNAGHVTFNNATGGFSGPAYEYDPNNRIDWTGFTPGLWTGNISSDWFTPGNWSDGNVPDAAVAVTIPAGTPNDPVVGNPGAPALALSVVVESGASLTVTDGDLEIINNLDIYGEFGMTLPGASVSFYDVFWYAGSTDNVINGTFYPEYAWWYLDGTNATLDPSSTVVFNSGLSTSGFGWQDPDAQIGNLVINKSAGNFIIGTVSTYAPKIAGSLDIMGGNSFYTQDYDMMVGGYTDILATGGLYLYFPTEATGPTTAKSQDIMAGPVEEGSKGGTVEITGDLNVSGTLDIADGTVLHHGLFGEAPSGVINITTGSFINDHPYGTEAWQLIEGTLNLTDGLFEISGNSISLESTFTGNISGGIIRTGFSFRANAPGIFQPTGGSVEFTCPSGNPFITLQSGNYFHDFIFNPNTLIILYSDIHVMNDLEINSGVLDSDTYDIYVGGNWTNNVGDGAFLEKTNTVFFNGDGTIQWVSAETFHDVVQLFVAPGSNLQFAGPTDILNDLTLNHFAFANDVFNVQGVVDLNNTSAKFTTNAAGIATIGQLQQGGTVVNNGGVLNVTDLAEDGFYGTWLNQSGTMNVNQDPTQWTDLNANMTINNGTVNVTGGNDLSFWGYGADASLTMSNGVLDFQEWGISVSGSFNVTENITGGTIRTVSTFTCSKPSFTPDGGIIELYGGTDADLAITNGAYANNVLINKSGGDETVFEYKDRFGNQVESGKANSVMVVSNSPIDGNLTVDAGSLILNAVDLSVEGNTNINNGGIVEVQGGAAFMTGDQSEIDVNSGGLLEVIGTAGNPATMTHTSGYYNLSVNSGGTISANHGVFEYNKAMGVHILAGGLVDPLNSFHNCTFRNGVTGGRLMIIHNNQTFNVNNAVFPTNTWAGSYNVWKNVNSGHVTFIGATGGFAGETYEYDPYNRIDWGAAGYALDLKVFCEGPYNGANMNTLINGVISLNHPFNPPLPYFGNPAPEWYYTGSESVPAIPNANVVDWIYVQLRDAVDANSATGATIIAEKAGFLLNDGSIVDLDGSSNLQFTETISSNLFVAVWQRNHLGIMSANPLPFAGGTYTYDFSAGVGQVYGATLAHKELSPGVWGMVSGDGNADGNISNTDKNDVWVPQAGAAGYLESDFNLDGNSNNADKLDFWVPNSGSGSQVPDYTPPGGFSSQVPD